MYFLYIHIKVLVCYDLVVNLYRVIFHAGALIYGVEDTEEVMDKDS